MSRATYNRKGECPEGYSVAHVTFDEGKSDKLYAYWTPPGWDVQPGDKLQVMVSERQARKWTTVRNVGGLMPIGAEHKCPVDHKVMVRERQEWALLHGFDAAIMDGDAPVFLDMKTVPSPHEKCGMQLDEYRRRWIETYGVPPRLLTSGRVAISNHVITDNIPKEHAMINLETPTFLNGKDIKNYSDAELFEIIRRDEAEIKNLMGIESKPKALKDRINELQAGIDALVKFMDSRA